MPELPDLSLYLRGLESRVLNRRLTGVRVTSPFLLRTAVPPLDAAFGRCVVGLSRLGKQLVFSLENDLHLVLHLMISGRLRWRDSGASARGRNVVAAFDFESGCLLFTEAGKKKRASLRVVAGADLPGLDPGGLDVFDCTLDGFQQRLQSSGHTLKRALTDQRVFAGIGNAYSDEILLAARLSPFKRAAQLSAAEVATLFHACREVLSRWTERLSADLDGRFPETVTAFHDDMAVHGKFRQPCPVCGAPVQRIRYAENEANYCARCQTGGRLLADRSLSRLLKDNWPKRLEDLEG